MKKTLITTALFAFAMMSQAATIKWTISGNSTYVINDVLGNPYANQTVYLISAADTSSLGTATDKDSFMAALDSMKIATAISSATGTKPSGVSNLEVSHDTLMEAGTAMTFGIVLVSEDSANGYYKLYTVNGTPFADDAPNNARTGKATTPWAATGIDKGEWTKSYAVAAVPEPSVALMGLLGLGMLLKRRRA